ncbi:MAG: hypothetical protein H5U16_06170 [Roseovarius sp.]|nr:hypothetical protein [Roseovarius sp.]
MPATDTQATPHTQAAAARATAWRILLCLAVLVAAWATSVAIWGIPGLYIPALALVPVIWVALLIISRG